MRVMTRLILGVLATKEKYIIYISSNNITLNNITS